MDTGTQILALLNKIEISVTLDGDDLVARPTSAVTPDVVDLLRENKATVVAALQPVQPDAAAPTSGAGAVETEKVFEIALDGGPAVDLGPDDTEGHDDHLDPRGLVAKFSREFGYVSIYDPGENVWHDVATKDGPAWAVSEARRRKDLWKAGNRRAYELSAREMERLWQAGQSPASDEGIVEDHPIEEDTK